ncbi:galactose-3-O-sulfotransferase 2 isoform X2 [Anabas testudineus]|uniref:galactose-3-O-sulfotransferase 2 isoform X2 n=1 Tax=Anabas testudineus TaxID=64144 RepID=UPI000E45CC81|nr:galactose-3-O-sulfotransferase 2 isoform X2 [Anabas testudineus]
MLSPPRRWRWIREQPLSSISTCLRRGLWSRHHYLWILLVLLVVCIAIQTFVAHQASDKLTGLPRLRFTVNKQHLFPTLQNIWEGLHSESSLAVNQDAGLLHTETTADPHHENEGYGKSLDNILWKHVDKNISLATGSQARKVSPGKLLQKHGDKPAVEVPGSSVLHGTRKGLIVSTHKRLMNTPTPSSVSETHINSVLTKATCNPKFHIVFLKTHKTASSTILNILYRYGESRKLTFALPLNKHSQLFYPFPFTSNFVEGVSSRSVKEFHIMCNHMRFRKFEVAKVMPKDSFYFSILRNPVAMMESIFIYYRSIPAFHKARSLDDFLDNGWSNYNASVGGNHYAHNILAFDFGFDNNVAADAEDLEERASMAIAAIEQDFHLILISEYFDESMILLRHALCWSLKDVVSFKLNSRSEQTRHPLLPNTAEKIKKWNALDWRIYLHFNTTFWHKVDTLIGQERMKTEVYELRELQGKLANTCLKDGGAVHPSQIKDTGLKPFQYGAAVIQGYNLNPHIDRQTKAKCQTLITPELQYTDRLYTQQFPELAAKLKKASKVVAPQRQHSLASARKAHHKQFVRHTFSNPNNQRAPTGSLLTHKESNDKARML